MPRRGIRKEDDEHKRRELEARYDDHRSRARFAKEEYCRTREKAVKNMKIGDVSMIIDSTGGSGTTFAPWYSTTEKMSRPDTKCARLNQQSLYFKG